MSETSFKINLNLNLLVILNTRSSLWCLCSFAFSESAAPFRSRSVVNLYHQDTETDEATMVLPPADYCDTPQRNAIKSNTSSSSSSFATNNKPQHSPTASAASSSDHNTVSQFMWIHHFICLLLVVFWSNLIACHHLPDLCSWYLLQCGCTALSPLLMTVHVRVCVGGVRWALYVLTGNLIALRYTLCQLTWTVRNKSITWTREASVHSGYFLARMVFSKYSLLSLSLFVRWWNLCIM